MSTFHLASVTDIAVPIKRVRRAATCLPWFTDRVVIFVAARDCLYIMSKRSRSSEVLLEYRSVRDCAHHAVEGARHALL